MDEHIYSMSFACQKYLDAANAVLAEYRSAGGLHTYAVNLAMKKFIELHELLLSACDNAESFVNTMTQHVRELEVAHFTNVLDPNVLSVVPKARPVLPVPVGSNCLLALVVDEKSELESDARHGIGANVAEELDTAASTRAVANPEEYHRIARTSRLW